MENYLNRLQTAIRKYWDCNALSTYKKETFKFSDLAIHVAKFHIIFEAADIHKGDKIAICAKNSARWCISFFASNAYNAIAVPILADFHPENINTLVDHADSSILFVDNDIWERLDIRKMPQLKAVFSCQDYSLLWSNNKKIAEAHDHIDELFAQQYPQGFQREDVHYASDMEDIAVINYTSGTTSAPKGVMLSYKALSTVVEFAHNTFPQPDGVRILSMLPMAHMYGLACEMLYAICDGTEVVLLGKAPNPTLLMRAMKEIKPILLITVPMVLEKIFKLAVLPKLNKPAMKVLLKIPGISHIVLSEVRKKLLDAFGGNIFQIVLGGAALNPEVEHWFKRIKLPITVGYGMTEAAPLIAYERPEKFVARSCGKAIDHVQVRIDSKDAQHEPGEIQVFGPNLMKGYFKNEEATRAAFTEDGWLRTGDYGVIDKAGNIFIRGRIKNMLLSSSGQNIYPEEIEAIINNEEGVQESVVVSRQGRLIGLVYFDPAFVKEHPTDKKEFTELLDQMRTRINEMLPSYSRIIRFEVVDAPFEKTPKMSIKRFLYS